MQTLYDFEACAKDFRWQVRQTLRQRDAIVMLETAPVQKRRGSELIPFVPC